MGVLKKGNKPTEIEHMLIYQIRGLRKKKRHVQCVAQFPAKSYLLLLCSSEL